jgi:hypothetical protein
VLYQLSYVRESVDSTGVLGFVLRSQRHFHATSRRKQCVDALGGRLAREEVGVERLAHLRAVLASQDVIGELEVRLLRGHVFGEPERSALDGSTEPDMSVGLRCQEHMFARLALDSRVMP